MAALDATTKITAGARLVAEAADGRPRALRAIGGVQAGGDFAVVWACSEREWATAQSERRDAVGIPWPAEDVSFRSGDLTSQ